MNVREFNLLKDTPVYRAGTTLTIELEKSGRVTWVVGFDGQEYGGDSFDQRGREKFDAVVADYVAAEHWQEV